MLGQLLTLARGVAHKAATSFTRDPRWKTVRRAWLFHNPECAVCGTRTLVEVHHVSPFEHDPSRELDDTNFITLCHWKGHHLLIGHGDSFRFYSPRVRELARQIRSGYITAEFGAAIAKNEREPIRTAA